MVTRANSRAMLSWPWPFGPLIRPAMRIVAQAMLSRPFRPADILDPIVATWSYRWTELAPLPSTAALRSSRPQIDAVQAPDQPAIVSDQTRPEMVVCRAAVGKRLRHRLDRSAREAAMHVVRSSHHGQQNRWLFSTPGLLKHRLQEFTDAGTMRHDALAGIRSVRWIS